MGPLQKRREEERLLVVIMKAHVRMSPGRFLLRHLGGAHWNNRFSGHSYGYDELNDNKKSGSISECLLERWSWDQENEINQSRRIVVVVDESREANVALSWAFSHVVNKSDTVILLHVPDSDQNNVSVSHRYKYPGDLFSKNVGSVEVTKRGFDLAKSLQALCKSHWPEVVVEVVAMEEEKGSTIVKQVKKLEASMLVLGQKKPSLFQRFFPSMKEDILEFCIANAECLTLGVRKQSNGMGGYILNSRFQKNFWLLA